MAGPPAADPPAAGPPAASSPLAASPRLAAGVRQPADGADPLVVLDEQLIAQLLRRARLARQRQRERRAARLPATDLAEENAMLRRYAAVLGEPGIAVAMALLALSNRLVREAEPEPGSGPAPGPEPGPGPGAGSAPGSQETGARGGGLEMPLPRGQR
ncbi:hypothetical protein [Streptomyces sp. TS71-3]|uniref:hypothetical protein n=1 Tax=Streptomyces sp. TS71-3 TaxID=2733862 RepID=UPI001BB3B75E|nr:hypothetical protein [Streptomyces sp. TS71-3]